MSSGLEIEIEFTDVTMAETEGVFKDVEKKMLSELPNKGKWMIKTNMTIASEFGIGQIEANFYYDGNIRIIEYDYSVGDVFYNPDIPALSQWAQKSGWKIPQPCEHLCATQKDFWKHFYDMLVVDCGYFDRVYGERIQLRD